MKAYELGPAEEAAPSPAVTPAGVPRRRFALSIRERRLVLAVADFIIGAAACYVAFFVLKHPHLRQLEAYEPFAVGAFWVVGLLMADGYAFQIPKHRNESAIAVLKALPVAVLLTVLAFFLHPYVLTRSVIAAALALGVVAMVVFRVTAARLLLHESLATKVILLSDSEPSPDVVAALRSARFEYRVVDTLICREGEIGADDLVDLVRARLESTNAEEVVVTSNELRLLPGLIEQCLTRDVRLVTAGDLVERYMGRVPVDSVDAYWYLSLPDSDIWRRPYAAVRRLSDLLLAAALGIPFLVIYPLIAAAIKLESPGPVLLTQRRVGEHGRVFDLFKLRSMREYAEVWGAQFASESDPRVTSVGRVLRSTRLDEFPQLLNILRGEMSFIGPRPERPEFMSELEAKIPHFRSRLLVKPGLTGWAQVRAGYASTIPEITLKLEYDLYYIKNRSVRLDLQILVATFGALLRGLGR